ncbi:low molecular weight protein-tyrosine-phosphatase [Spelaeicoccus albus]|uniref:protein-tyrosine-phosphatase n=1 Tax=Spelaeicoccus albus TaxID=1280376 RepID=A0A7Z0D0I5_9MICO|nr:low molecular weight protein-tyrosine-phosphatase [Spelaeicoccus albus]NYI67391.1 protein-tyrosine phosphatase [Spelaeicoccus albus]
MSYRPDAYRILTVCTGNICRSPMAEVLLRDRFADLGIDVVIDSAGVSAEESGNPMDERAQRALRRRGYAPGAHTARRVSAEWLPERDLVLVMTAAHERAVARLAEAYRPDVAARVHRYREFDDAATGDLDIADPWYGDDGDYETVMDQLETGLPGIIDYVQASRRR